MYIKERLIELIEKKTLFLDILREVADDLLDEMLLIEAQRFIDKKQEILSDGKRRLVLNGTHQSRSILFPFGSVDVTAPRDRDRKVDADPIVFASETLPSSSF
ncbi:MAG: hypothetical protein LBJ61_01115 [Deltaproteobacteria bacterium]|jgi:hypothetical protein|nr:hypothetical protein [Deltaproteobacteria bacterium]